MDLPTRTLGGSPRSSPSDPARLRTPGPAGGGHRPALRCAALLWGYGGARAAPAQLSDFYCSKAPLLLTRWVT